MSPQRTRGFSRCGRWQAEARTLRLKPFDTYALLAASLKRSPKYESFFSNFTIRQ